MTADEQGYNGWTNYETWLVNLWLSQEQPLYHEARRRAARAEGDAHALADDLKEWVRNDLTPDLGSSLAADLLGSALDDVNWDEIAPHWFDE